MTTRRRRPIERQVGTMSGVRVLALPQAAASQRTHKLVATMHVAGLPAATLTGRTAAGRWAYYLARAEWHKGGRRLTVLGRAETETAIAVRVRRELTHFDTGELVLFAVGR